MRIGGPQQIAISENGGYYRLPNAPLGAITLRATYTGHESATARSVVSAVNPATLDFKLASRGERTPLDEAVRLGAFVVSSEREGQAKALTEQRNAMNVKTVVTAGNFGDIAEGNIGELLKFMPGVTLDYFETDTRAARMGGLEARYGLRDARRRHYCQRQHRHVPRRHALVRIRSGLEQQYRVDRGYKTLSADMPANAGRPAPPKSSLASDRPRPKSNTFMGTAVKIYDTTLRDGTQGEGISFSVTDKLLIAQKLDAFGVDYIEGGFPGSNPRDIAFFQEAKNLKLKHARLAAFGSTRRAGTKAAEDTQLRTLLESGMPVMTIVGKTWTLHVTEILRTTLEENLAMIEDSARYLVSQGREVIYDAEHYFDGFKSDPDYALRTLAGALRGGASNLTLCDTNGGTLVDEFKEIVGRAVKEFGADKVGVHCHNDGGLGVALTLAGVGAGATLVQGTMNGYGERVGNANMATVLPNLFLKMDRKARCAANLTQLRDLSLFFDELANLRPDPKAPFVGQSAFAHKGGLHANAAQKVARSYEHIDPALVGNRTRVLVSDMAGRSSLALKAKELGLELDEKRPEMKGLIEELKEREFRGYEYEAADGSFRLLVERHLGQRRAFFEVESYRVMVERHGADLWSEATVKLKVAGESIHTVAEDTGPIGALDKALRLALETTFPQIRSVALRDYKVRILENTGNTSARTRVLIESGDGAQIWGTVGVSDNIIDASWEALRESVEFKLSQT